MPSTALLTSIAKTRNAISLSGVRKLAFALVESDVGVHQVERIETYQVEARLDLAIRLSKALGKTLDEVFPGAGRALAKHEKEGGPYLPPSLNEYDIETDICTWHFKFLLKGHRHPLIYEVPVSERRRLEHCLANLNGRSRNSPFIVFDTSDKRAALNMNELQGRQLLYDVDFVVITTTLGQSYNTEPSENASTEDEPQEVNIFRQIDQAFLAPFAVDDLHLAALVGRVDVAPAKRQHFRDPPASQVEQFVEWVIAPARLRPLLGFGRLRAGDEEKTGAENNSNYLGTGKPFSSVQATESHKYSLLNTTEISPAPFFPGLHQPHSTEKLR